MPPFFLTRRDQNETIRLALRPGAQTLGRASDCDLVVTGPSVSKRHAQIDIDGEHVTIRDLGSKNGTLVNGRAVGDPMDVRSGDTVTIGSLLFQLRDSGAFESTRLARDGEVRTPFTTSVAETLADLDKMRSRRILEAVHEAGQILAERVEVTGLYARVLALLGRFLNADRLLVLSATESAGTPEVLASSVSAAQASEPLRLSRTLLRDVVDNGRSLLTEDAAIDDRFASQQSVIFTGIHSAMAAPLFHNGEVLGMIYVDSLHRSTVYSQEDLRLLTLLANMTAVKVVNCRIEDLERERERLQGELELAARIQRNLLPREVPCVDGLEVFAHHSPCHEVGGDLYDVRLLPDGKMWIVLGDVTGKGIGAALLMSNVMAGLRMIEEDSPDPLALVTRLEARLTQIVEPGQFVTLFAGLLEPSTGRLEYVNAGHPAGIVHAPDALRRLDSTSPPLALLPDAAIVMAETTLAAGENLLIFSDGVTETMKGELMYDEERLPEFLSSLGLDSAERLGAGLLADVAGFRGDAPVADDITLLVVRRL